MDNDISPARGSAIPLHGRDPADGSSSRYEISVLEFLNSLLRRRKLVFGLPLLIGAGVAVVVFLLRPSYTATSSFVPEARAQNRLPAGLAGLAGQFGVSLGAEASESPRFYADVVKSRELLERIILARYPAPMTAGEGRDSVRLLEILEVRGNSAADSMYRAVKKLRTLIGVSVDKQTNIVRLNVDARYPELAASIANRFVTYLNDFNARTRQSQARERRKFIEQRLDDGESQLRNTEEELRRFYERNRSWQQSPQLVFEEGRLRRQVEIRQDLYLTLRREYETARIEEVNDTPIFTVIDRAVPPTRKSKPKRAVLVGVAILTTLFITVTCAGVLDYFEQAKRAGNKDYQEFRGILADVAKAMGLHKASGA